MKRKNSKGAHFLISLKIKISVYSYAWNEHKKLWTWSVSLRYYRYHI